MYTGLAHLPYCIQGCLDIQGVEAGLDLDKVCSSLYKRLCLLPVCGGHVVETVGPV